LKNTAIGTMESVNFTAH